MKDRVQLQSSCARTCHYLQLLAGCVDAVEYAVFPSQHGHGACCSYRPPLLVQIHLYIVEEGSGGLAFFD